MIPIGETSDEVKCEDLVKIIIGDDPEKFFQVGSQLSQQEREELVEFLKWNIDVFAWNTYEAPGVDPDFICHHLNVNPDQTESLLEEIHERICGSHIGGRSLAHRPLLKVIGGQICRKKLWNTLKSVISTSGTHQVYTNQGESSIHYLAHGHSLNGT